MLNQSRPRRTKKTQKKHQHRDSKEAVKGRVSEQSRPEGSMLRRNPTQPEFQKILERRKVGVPTRLENVRKHRKFDSSRRYPETLASAPTRRRTEPDEQTRLSTITKESRRSMKNQTPDWISGDGTQDGKPEPEEATEDADKAWSQERPKSRRARRASS
jgi:hypothetical protein